jgi:hypothetical protein
LFLVFADRNFLAAMDQNIRSHEHRVRQQARVDIVGLGADLVLERGAALQFADIGMHVEQKV